MRPPRCVVLLTLSVVLPQLFACHSWRPVLTPEPGLHDEMRVKTRQGQVLHLSEVRVDSVSIAGSLGPQQKIEIPLPELEGFETRHFSAWKTLAS